MRGLRRDMEAAPDQPEIVAVARAKHHAMLAKADRRAIAVDRGVAHREHCHQATGSVQTLKLSSVFAPNVVAIATSDASRPRAMRTRPTRGTLLRGSNRCQRPPIHASNHAAKSPALNGGWVPMSLR